MTTVNDKLTEAQRLLSEAMAELLADSYKRYFVAQAIAELNKLNYQEPPKWVKPAKGKK